MRIGQNVLNLLKEQSKKQSELAEYLNIQPSTINGWRQENRNPSSELIIPICEFLAISPYYLLTGKEQPPNIQEETANEPLNDDEKNLIDIYRSLDDESKIVVKAEAVKERRRDNPNPNVNR
ncbi:MAG: helix-turn-helix domain-containing protein [Oscillospiraceae bacterium]|nr:helix-turn-helix domain-containing protein [Oscillospiraceae bacterium]